MTEHVRVLIRACPCCQKMGVVKISIQSYGTSKYWFRRPGGYILTIIDPFTRCGELCLCDAQEAARCLFEHFRRFRAPSQILSDRGSHFVNHVKIV